MRRPRRNLEIFSISALDLFASALGAFIIVAIILFPYYLKAEEARSEVEELRSALEETRADLEESKTSSETAMQQLAEARSELEEAEAELDSTQSELQEARIELARTFLVIGIDWTAGGADIDLHVTDPDGNTFYYARNNRTELDFPGTKAQLSYDMLTGPGIELWQNPEAKTGTYKIEYDPYRLPSSARVTVKGSVFERRGRVDLAPVILSREAGKVTAATVTISPEGRVSIEQQ